MKPNNIIDAWAQHPTLRFIREPMFESLRRWTKSDILKQEIPVEFTAAAMQEAGVSTALLCSWHGPQGALISNDEVAEWVNRFPDRFTGIATVDLTRPVAAVKELNRCVQELGFKGLRIVQWLWNLPPTHAYYYPLFAECVRLDIPVGLQVGHTGPLRPSEVGRPIPYIDQIALDFPELRIVCGHIGYPWTTEMIAVATKHENVFIDTSAYLPSRYPPELVRYMQTHGQNKVLFGTNYPMLMPAKCLEQVAQLELKEEVQEKFLHANAKRVYKL